VQGRTEAHLRGGAKVRHQGFEVSEALEMLDNLILQLTNWDYVGLLGIVIPMASAILAGIWNLGKNRGKFLAEWEELKADVKAIKRKLGLV